MIHYYIYNAFAMDLDSFVTKNEKSVDFNFFSISISKLENGDQLKIVSF